jgi:hypothetical protein
VSGVVLDEPPYGTAVFSLLVPPVQLAPGRATAVHTLGITTVQRPALMALPALAGAPSRVLLSGKVAEHLPRSELS